MTLRVVTGPEPVEPQAPAPATGGAGFHVPLVGPPREDNEYLRATGYDLLHTGTGEGFMANAATFLQEQGVLGPVLGELERRRKLGEATEVWTPYTAFGLLEKQKAPVVTPMAEEEWKQSPYARPGLSYTEGMTTEWAKELAERHDTQTKRADIVARSSAWETVPGAIAGSLVDPIGLTANFVPIVSEARYAAMAARLGRFGARAATGLVEGAVGQAALEPFIYQAAQGDQRDYDFTDSLSNIALGGVFGAGLHSALGGVGDLLRRKGVQAHVEAGDIAVRQAALGHDIDVSPALRMRPAAAGMAGLPQRADVAAPSADLGAMASRRGQAEVERLGGFADPGDTRPYGDLDDLIEAGSVPSVQGHGIAGADPEQQLTKLLTDGIDKDRPFHTGDISKANDMTLRAAGIGAKTDSPYVLLARPGENIKEGGIGAVIVNGAARGNLADLRRAFPHVKFLEPDEVAAWAASGPRAARGAADRAAVEQMRAGEDLENRAWREADFEHVQAYYSAARGLDEEAHINPTPLRGLGDVPKAPPGPVEDDYFFDPIDDVDMIDDPEALLAEAEEWAGAGRMEQPETVVSGAAKEARGIAEVKGPDGRPLWKMTREEFLASRPRGGQAGDVDERFMVKGLEEHGPPGLAIVDQEGSSIRTLVARGADGRVEGVVGYNWNDAAGETWLETLKKQGEPDAALREEASTLKLWVRQDRRGAGLADQMYDALQAKGVNIDAASGYVTTEAGAKFAHQRAVRRANEAGLQVPENVLADYADLPPAKPGMKMGEAVDMTDPVVKAERYGAAVKAMAACMAGAA